MDQRHAKPGHHLDFSGRYFISVFPNHVLIAVTSLGLFILFLVAALDPNDTDYFYYALNPDTGEHKFSKTEKEHADFLAKLKDD